MFSSFFRSSPCSSLLLIALSSASFSWTPAAQAQSVLTQNNDNARTGANTQETRLTPFNVNTQRFGKLFTINNLEANVNGQPLYVANLAVGSTAHNTLFAYTSNNTDHSPCGLWAFDADTGATLWHDTLPNSATYTTPTPTIDLAASIIYVLTKTDNDDTGKTYLHAFDLATGQEKPGSPIQVQASAPGTGDGSANGKVYFDGDYGHGRFHANDRVGLLFSQGTVYTAFARNSDSNPYHGWVLGYQYDGTQFTQKYVFCTTPNGSSSNTPGGGDGGVWQAGKGLTADADGNIYCSVGNGTFDANTGGIDYGMCCLKLSPSLAVLDWFAPFDEKAQSDQDLDLGNCGLTSIPGTNRLFIGGSKFGSAFLLDSTNLGHFTPNGPDAIVARIDNVSGVDGVNNYNAVGQNSIAWDAGSSKYVYLWPNDRSIEQYRYDPSVNTFNPSNTYKQSPGQTAGGSLAVSSNGTANGILWAVDNNGVVHAYPAADISQAELWDSGQNSNRDALGSVGHFQFPTVVNGKVYVPTGDARIVVYGLLPSAAPLTHVLWTNTDGQASVWNYVSSSGHYAPLYYGPYSGWTARALADGPDGNTRLLWTKTDGTAAMWSLNTATGAYTHHEFGPYSGWTASGISVGVDNTTHLLWNNSNGTAALWDYETTRGTFTQRLFGPFAGWTAKSAADGGDGKARLLWTNTSGQAALWSLDSTDAVYTHHEFGPYSGWMAEAISLGPANTTHILWDNTNGQAALWNTDSTLGTFTQRLYGPYTGWSAIAAADGADGNTRLLWHNSSTAMSVWNLDSVTGVFSSFNFGPYSGWSAVGISTGM